MKNVGISVDWNPASDVCNPPGGAAAAAALIEPRKSTTFSEYIGSKVQKL